MAKIPAHRRATTDPLSTPRQGEVCPTLAAAKRRLGRVCLGSTFPLSAHGLRNHLPQLHAEHVRLGGREKLPSLQHLTTTQMVRIARHLVRTNELLERAAK